MVLLKPYGEPRSNGAYSLITYDIQHLQVLESVILHFQLPLARVAYHAISQSQYPVEYNPNNQLWEYIRSRAKGLYRSCT